MLKRIRIETDKEKTNSAGFVASPFVHIFDAETGEEMTNVIGVHFNATVDAGAFAKVALLVGLEGEFDAEIIEGERT